MTIWQPIETAPKGRLKIDVWAKRWNAKTDGFEFRRFTDCYFSDDGELWGISPEYRATNWMPLPEPPSDALRASA
jgi:Protein of unknown function (DUF551)